MRRDRLAIIAGCVVAFGVLMGLRSQLEPVWLRTIVAASAGGVLGTAIALSQRRRS